MEVRRCGYDLGNLFRYSCPHWICDNDWKNCKFEHESYAEAGR